MLPLLRLAKTVIGKKLQIGMKSVYFFSRISAMWVVRRERSTR